MSFAVSDSDILSLPLISEAWGMKGQGIHIRKRQRTNHLYAIFIAFFHSHIVSQQAFVAA